MHPETALRNAEDRRDATDPPHVAADDVSPGAIIDILGSRHRIVALVEKRVLASDLRTHHPYLVQDADGSIQLPRISLVRQMIESGQAVPVTTFGEPSATERMRTQIDMLNAAEVRQGDKAIWIFLAARWTAELTARFGPHDPPWKIRRWRAALRKETERGAVS